MKRRLLVPLFCSCLLASALAGLGQQDEPLVLDSDLHHLGNDPTPDWSEASPEPEGTSLEFEFEARELAGESVLFVTHRSVDDPWHIEINGRRVATLKRKTELADHHYSLPAGVFRDGTNVFELVPEVPADDIVFGNIRLYAGSLREVFDLRVVEVRVLSQETGEPWPARITVTNEELEPVSIYYGESLTTAVRQGVVYSSGESARFELPPGRYRFFATHGTEWGLAEAGLEIADARHSIELVLRREVDTAGYVACDTHVHTLTFSGHGDSSVEERMVTLAGEGVELAIATDHNHNTDYSPYQLEVGVQDHFTPVVGNEVSTPIGHLNAFPLDPADEVPAHDLHDIVRIVDGIRAKGAQVVILNHPRWPEHETGPHGVYGLDPFTGDTEEPWSVCFDAMELVNSQTEEREPFLLFSDWFALLNRGEELVAVGSSDSHTVGGVVGQGRTYVRSSSDAPASIDVDECCKNIVAGRSSVSLGILADVLCDGRSAMGELVGEVDSEAPLVLRVAAPSWVVPERASVFVNGTRVHEVDVPTVAGEPTNVFLELPAIASITAQGHDAWLVCVVTGAPVNGPWWPQVNPYTLAASNPVYLDRDGDGRYRSPRATALALVEEQGTSPQALERLFERSDQAVSIQILAQVRERFLREAHLRMIELGNGAAEEHPELEAYLSTLKAPE